MFQMTGQKGCFPCEICVKTFNFNFRLREHMRRHTGEFRYFCKVCGKGVMAKQDMTAHMVTHGSEKPFKCQICGLDYGMKSRLKKHMLNVHGQLDSTFFSETDHVVHGLK